MRHRGGNVLRDQAFYERLRASPLNPMESGPYYHLQAQGDFCGIASSLSMLAYVHHLFNVDPCHASIHTLRWKERPLQCPRCQSQDIDP
jgi:hypothetical protein